MNRFLRFFTLAKLIGASTLVADSAASARRDPVIEGGDCGIERAISSFATERIRASTGFK